MRFSFVILILLLVSACDRRSKFSEGNESALRYDMAATSAGNGQEEGNALINLDRMLIREASINFQCADVVQTKKQLDNLVRKYKGYSSNEGQHQYEEDRVMYSHTIRVPAANLDTLMMQIEALASVIDNKNISSEDVTEEFIDVSTRLATKKELETRYREILKSARTVEEVISVERELNNVRSEIESIEGRVNYLQNRVQYSTIHVSYYQRVSGGFGFRSKFMRSFGIGWNNFLSFIIALFQAWPFVIMVAGGVWLFIYIRKSRKS